MLKNIVYLLIYILSITIVVPAISIYTLNSFFKDSIIKNNQNLEDTNELENEVDEIVDNLEFYNTSENTLENNLDNYLIGVVAAEMPISFEVEALKAQAVAARTYAYKRQKNINETIDPTKIGQAFNTLDEMKNKWGKNFDKNYKKIKDIVYSTKGLVMLYENEPIEAVFHSTSAGMTETAENIWGKNLPYIKSVDSKVDENAPNFYFTTKISNNEFIKKIANKFNDLDKNKILKTFNIKKRSNAGYVLEVEICGKSISGREIRNIFGIRSTNFTIEKNKDYIIFKTKGYGHGAGMSQYGANFMAKEGKTFSEILNHYYKGIIIEEIY